MPGDQCITVLDTGETERRGLPLRRPLAGRRRAGPRARRREYAGQRPERRRLRRLGVGHRPGARRQGRDRRGGHRRRTGRGLASTGDQQADRSHTLAAMLQSAAIRFSRAEVEAITDGLTGLYNHRYLHERLEEELKRARRRDSTLSLLFCDCDHFKVYNDSLRPQGRRRRPGAHRPHHRGLQPAHRSGRPLRRRGVRAGADRHRHRGRAALSPSASAREVEAASAKGGQPLTVSIGVAGFPEERRRPRRASRQGRLGDVRGQARRTQPRAGLLRRLRGPGDLALATGAVGHRQRRAQLAPDQATATKLAAVVDRSHRWLRGCRRHV